MAGPASKFLELNKHRVQNLNTETEIAAAVPLTGTRSASTRVYPAPERDAGSSTRHECRLLSSELEVSDSTTSNANLPSSSGATAGAATSASGNLKATEPGRSSPSELWVENLDDAAAPTRGLRLNLPVQSRRYRVTVPVARRGPAFESAADSDSGESGEVTAVTGPGGASVTVYSNSALAKLEGPAETRNKFFQVDRLRRDAGDASEFKPDSPDLPVAVFIATGSATGSYGGISTATFSSVSLNSLWASQRHVDVASNTGGTAFESGESADGSGLCSTLPLPVTVAVGDMAADSDTATRSTSLSLTPSRSVPVTSLASRGCTGTGSRTTGALELEVQAASGSAGLGIADSESDPPAAPVTVTSESAAAGPGASGNLKLTILRLKVLLADDEPVNRSLAKRMLSRLVRTRIDWEAPGRFFK